MNSRVVSWCFLLMFLCGLFFTGMCLYIPVKAWTAQVLLENSWKHLREGKGSTTPWPWADFTPVACLLFPGHRCRTIVVNSASGTSLAFAPGHLDGSAGPGSPGNCVIFGHRETHFSILQDCKTGDPVEISCADGRVKRYIVAETMILNPGEISRIVDTDDNQLTLVTCYPFTPVLPANRRFVVIAKEG
jgi:sortase A